jgi:hypothetical protein
VGELAKLEATDEAGPGIVSYENWSCMSCMRTGTIRGLGLYEGYDYMRTGVI